MTKFRVLSEIQDPVLSFGFDTMSGYFQYHFLRAQIFCENTKKGKKFKIQSFHLVLIPCIGNIIFCELRFVGENTNKGKHQKDGNVLQQMLIGNEPGTSFKFNVSNTKPGAYFITIKGKGKEISQRVVVE